MLTITPGVPPPPPRSAVLEADALTTEPSRQCGDGDDGSEGGDDGGDDSSEGGHDEDDGDDS